MSERIDILQDLGTHEKPSLELVTIREDETALVPFTATAEKVALHFCEDDEVE